jgi:hypothetical protein
MISPIILITAIAAADSIDNWLGFALSGSRGGLIWLEDFSGCTSQTLNVDVMIANPDDPFDSFGFYLTYNTDVLEYTGCMEGELDPGWQMFGCNEPVSGELRCAGFAFPGSIPENSLGSLITLTFAVTCASCLNGDESSQTFSNLTDDLADFGNITGTFTYFCTPAPTPTPSKADTISIDSSSGCLNDEISVAVRISNPSTAVDSFGFYLEYCPENLEYLECSTGALNPGWTIFGCNEPETGQVRCAGFAFPGSIPAGSSGTMVILAFKILCSACEQGEACSLHFSALTDDLSGWQSSSGTFACSCSPSPTPVPVTSDRIWIGNFSGCTGETLEADVMIDNPDTAVDSFGFYLDFCEREALRFVSCEPGTLNPGWVIFGCNEPTNGRIASGGFVVSGGIAKGSHGSLVHLAFQVTCTECTSGESYPVVFSKLTDDLAGWGLQNCVYTYLCPTPTPGTGILNGSVMLERLGVTPPNPSWSIPLTLRICSGGSPGDAFITSTDQSGHFSVAVPGGTHDFLIKNSHTMANYVAGITVPTGGSTGLISFGTLHEGDADDDNLVISWDFFILKATYNKAEGDPGYDDRADFSEDQAVTSADFFLMRTHYNQAGDECGSKALANAQN